ncbi:uncharacterized protein [Drosophila takahashii]|uniref:uncharacterized protein n=1 Tax=Drosophila takahashii TaxID=29030 RepID=UPI0038996479
MYKQDHIDQMLENASLDASTKYSLWKLTSRFKRQVTQRLLSEIPLVVGICQICTEVNDDNMLIAPYADDIAVLVRSPSIEIATLGLQEYVTRFEKWTTEWNIGINCSKCACVIFSTRPKDCPGISMLVSVLRQEAYYKYLGVILDRGLTFQRHTTMIKQSVLSKAAKQAESATQAEITTRIQLLDDVWKEFNEFGDAIAVHEEVEGYVDPEIDNAIYEEKYLRAIAILKDRSDALQPSTSTGITNGSNGLHSNNDAIVNLLQQNQQLFERLAANQASSSTPVQVGGDVTLANLSSVFAANSNQSELPKIQIKRFSGNYTEWPSFQDIYENTIHNKQQPNTQKFHHLKTLLVDETANLVRHLAITETAYNTAWERLKERYNRLRHIVNSFLEQFMSLPTTTKFLDSRCEELELSKRELATGGKTITHAEKPKRVTQSMVAVEGSGCTKCNSTEHSLYSCQQFLDMSGMQRRSFAIGNLAQIAGEDERNTSASNNTSVTLSHFAQGEGTQSAVCAQGNAKSAKESEVKRSILPTAMAYVQNAKGDHVTCRLLLDTGSELSYVSERCIQALGLTRSASRILVTGISSVKADTTRGCSTLHIKSRISEDLLVVYAHVLGRITSSLERQNIDASALKVFKDLQLADTEFNTNSPVDILLGSEHVWSVFTGRKMYDNKGNLIAISSVFGWVITSLITSSPSNAIALTTTVDIGATLQKFWELENVQSSAKLEPEDDQVEKHFLATHSRDENGKYIVELPFNTENPEFGQTQKGALKRFKSVERRLQQNEQLRTQYVHFMREYTNLGHMREVPPEENATGNQFYLPHHPVLGRKLRVVFDKSFRDANGKALNDTLFTGPSIQRDLFATNDGDTQSAQTSPVKVLGLYWHPGKDILTYNVGLAANPDCTKRQVLSDVSRIFDPLGLLAPIVIQFKILFQKLWLLNLDWDDPLPTKLADNWLKWRADLDTLQKFRLPRFVPNDPDNIELHGFSDASTKAYAAVVYIRVTNDDGSISVSIVAAKTRVAPLKQQSLPRLELCAALLLSQLIRSITSGLRHKNITVFGCSDSSIVLSWLSYAPAQLKTFVGNRTSEILDTIPRSAWRHVDSKTNPADCASRGLMAADLIDFHLWWNGPQWLRDKDQYLVKLNDSRFGLSLTDKRIQGEVKSSCLATLTEATQIHILDELIDRVSSWIKLVHIVGYVMRFIQRTRNSSREKASRALSFDEIKAAHHISKLILEHEHRVNLHPGVSSLFVIVRQKFWIFGARNLIRKITHDCLACFRQRSHTSQQQMANLPSVRITQALPFIHTGCDYAGPILLKDAKVRKPRISKGYICLFVCMVTSAIHLELATDLTTETFLAALRRFISLRGKCSKIYSDNGTNFIGAKRSLDEMQELLSSQTHKDTVSSTLADDGIQWVLIPPRAPHWGGKWESAVRCVKLHLRRITGNSTLTFEQMRTLLAQKGAVINSRPLCHTPDTETNYLSPAHFLIGRPLTTVPDPDLSHIPVGRLGYWQSIQSMLQGFWKKWHQEYLTTLQQRPKWTTSTPNISTGNVVLVKESNSPPASWHIARVMEIYPGKDDLVRAVKLKTQAGEMTRPITKVAVLPHSETVFQGGPGCS